MRTRSSQKRDHSPAVRQRWVQRRSGQSKARREEALGFRSQNGALQVVQDRGTHVAGTFLLAPLTPWPKWGIWPAGWALLD